MKEWIVFYLLGWEELTAITVNGIIPGEIMETEKLLAFENAVTPTDITIKTALR